MSERNFVIAKECTSSAAPLDFSFKNVQELKELIRLEQRSGRRAPIPEEVEEETKDSNAAGNQPQKSGQESEDEEQEDQPKVHQQVTLKPPQAPAISKILADANISAHANKTSNVRGDEDHSQVVKKTLVKTCTTGILLNNNFLRELTDLSGILNKVLISPRRLRWIDLSHNQIMELTTEFSAFSELYSLNLHANYINDMREVAKLQNLRIKSLTMNGNPIEQLEGYRCWIIALMPFITKLDTSLVTKMERYSADWGCESQAFSARMLKSKKAHVSPPVLPPPQPEQHNAAADSQAK